MAGLNEGWGRRGTGGKGCAETRRILKTFAVLLIFFSKWVKLFYDFQRASFSRLRAALLPAPSSRRPFPLLTLPGPLSSLRRVAASRALSEAYFLVENHRFLPPRIRVSAFSRRRFPSRRAAPRLANARTQIPRHAGNFSIRFATIPARIHGSSN